MKNIILFGGSFDPIHNGHLNMARIAKAKLQADKVIFIPNGVSVWKEKGTSPSDKYEMVKLAIKKEKGFSISDFELNREANYTIHTIRYFKEVYPKDNLFFLIGADQVNQFHNWKEVDEISSSVKVVYFKRTGFELESKNIEKYKMKAVEGMEVDVSSTEVRTLTRPDTSIEVLEYIQNHDLYFVKEVEKHIDGKRLEHSKSVALLAYKIALNNKIEKPYRAYIAGLLHDIGKNVDSDIKKYVEENYKQYLPLDEKLYHQFYSAKLAKEVFHIEDQDIIQAIEYHATGINDMNPIAKIVYASDKIDPKRGYNSSKMIKAMMADYKEGFIYVLKENKKHLLSKGRNINNVLTEACLKQYL